MTMGGIPLAASVTNSHSYYDPLRPSRGGPASGRGVHRLGEDALDQTQDG